MTSRLQMIAREIEEYKQSGNEATYPIEIRGQKKYLPIIRVNPTDLLLNPKNNRLAGQLKDHPNRNQIEADPCRKSLRIYWMSFFLRLQSSKI